MKKIICHTLGSRSANICAALALGLTTLLYSSPTIPTAQAHTVQRNNRNSPRRRIEIDLSDQVLRAWDGRTVVYMMPVSTGKPSTPTPVGRYRVQTKLRSTRMRGPGYDISNVPYTMYYYRGYAIHGAPWRKNFNVPGSHGCVNLSVKHARMLYRWAKVGTPVIVKR